MQHVSWVQHFWLPETLSPFYVKFAKLLIFLMQHDCRIHYFTCIHGRILEHPTFEFTIIFSVKMTHTFDQYSMSIWL